MTTSARKLRFQSISRSIPARYLGTNNLQSRQSNLNEDMGTRVRQ